MPTLPGLQNNLQKPLLRVGLSLMLLIWMQSLHQEFQDACLWIIFKSVVAAEITKGAWSCLGNLLQMRSFPFLVSTGQPEETRYFPRLDCQYQLLAEHDACQHPNTTCRAPLEKIKLWWPCLAPSCNVKCSLFGKDGWTDGFHTTMSKFWLSGAVPEGFPGRLQGRDKVF